MSFKLDLHVHTVSRSVAYVTAADLAAVFRKRRIDGVAVTNFFDVSHARRLREELSGHVILVGQEVWSTDGHVLALGIRERIPDFAPAADTIARIHDQGGLAVAPHPYLALGLNRKVLSLPVDAVEVYNAGLGYFPYFNARARRLARRRGVPGVAGSDTSDPRYIGRTCVEVLVEKPEEILEGLRQGRVKLRRVPVPIPVLFMLKCFLYFRDLAPCRTHPVPCMVCGKSMVLRPFRRRRVCLDCGRTVTTRIVCSHGHYLCLDCVMKRHTGGAAGTGDAVSTAGLDF